MYLLKYRKKGQKDWRAEFLSMESPEAYPGGRTGASGSKEVAPADHFLQPAGEKNENHDHKSPNNKAARGV